MIAVKRRVTLIAIGIGCSVLGGVMQSFEMVWLFGFFAGLGFAALFLGMGILEGGDEEMTEEYRCPFCGTSLEKREMQFHVGIPLCMEMRKKKSKQVELKAAIGGTFPVPELDYEYFGNRGIRDLLAYQMDRLTMGHPDEGKPIKMEEFVDHSED